MKKNFILLAVVLFSVSAQLSALSLVHYWNFNGANVPLLTEGAGTLKNGQDVVLTPLTPIQADSSMTTTRATLIYQAKAGTASPFMSYWDTSTGSTGNARNGDAAGNCLRPRDAWSSMELVLNIPSTDIKNLKIMYDVQRSGSGPNVNTYSYSIDGGTTWKSDGLSTNGGALGTNSITTVPSSGFATTTVTITDPIAENNAKLKFRIWFSDPTNTAGNNRIDNITVEGDPLTSAISNHKINSIAMYPNPCKTGRVNFSDNVNVEVFNMTGKQIKSVSKTNKLITTDLVKGVYLVRLNGVSTQKLVVE
jgi:hypothetical protein